MDARKYFYVVLACCVGFVAGSKIKLGVFISWTSKSVKGYRYAGAVTRAIDDVNNDPHILNGTELTYIQRDSGCNNVKSVASAIDLYNEDIDAFVGPVCSKSCLAVGLISTSKGIPLVTYGCSSIELSNKKDYPYLTRSRAYARGSSRWTPSTFTGIMQHFKWRRACVVESISDIYTPMAKKTLEEFIDRKFVVHVEKYNSDTTTFEAKKKIMEELKKNYRIFFFLTNVKDVTEFLVQAYHLGLTKKSEYAFVHVDFKFLSWNEEREKAYGVTYDVLKNNVLQGLIVVSIKNPSDDDNEKYVAFKNDVATRLKKHFNESDTGPTVENFTVTMPAPYLYDAIVLYARAVDAMWKSNRSNLLSDAPLLFKYMSQTSFQGMSGKVVIDEHGDRIPEFDVGNVHDTELYSVANFDPLKNQTLDMLRSEFYFPGGGKFVPKDSPECGFDGELCPKTETSSVLTLAVVICTAVVVTVILIIAFYMYNKHKYETKLLMRGLIINMKEISFGVDNSSMRSRISAMNVSGLLRRTSELLISGKFFPAGTSKVVLYKTSKCYLKTIKQCKIELTKDLLLHMKQMKELNHTNVNVFHGVIQQGTDFHLLWLFCFKGSLQDVLQNEDIDCDWMFRYSFAKDIAKGLYEIHRSAIGAHGNLNSSNCMIDNRWVCKISNFGMQKFNCGMKSKPQNSYHQYKKRFWKAPEMLKNLECAVTPEADMYSFGIILYEICTRGDPYEVEMNNGELPPQDIIERIKVGGTPSFRPFIPDDTGASPEFVRFMSRCWSESPDLRPSSKEAARSIHKIQRDNGKNGGLVDNMLIMMEKYTNNLEELVANRTEQLEVEKAKTEKLLYKMLPISVANKLKDGQPVVAESFDSVTIFFSDIVGFTSLCSESTPLEVVAMLNDLYTCFDNCIDRYDVYKVETIGDAYMVVSGIPIRNENRHAGEIATMSMDLLSNVRTFRIKHRPEVQLQLRIGMHSGSCVAGVVGLKMPRYCLFGDTVNYASRMESTGVALKIHVSPECALVLQALKGYTLETRGPVQMKGKGTIETFFLTGKVDLYKILPDCTSVQCKAT